MSVYIVYIYMYTIIHIHTYIYILLLIIIIIIIIFILLLLLLKIILLLLLLLLFVREYTLFLPHDMHVHSATLCSPFWIEELRAKQVAAFECLGPVGPSHGSGALRVKPGSPR